MKRILYAQQDGLVTGSAMSLSLVLKHLDRDRFLPRVLLAREGPARGLFESQGLEVDVVPFRCFWTAPVPRWLDPDYLRNFLGILPNRRVVDYLDRLRPDIVHVNDKASLVVGMSARRLRIPVVWHLRSGYSGADRWLQPAVSARVIRSSARALVAISEDEIAPFDEFPALSVVHNGVDLRAAELAGRDRTGTRAELGIPQDTLAVGMVGRLNDEKGAWNFIRATALVRRALMDRDVLFFVVAPLPVPGDREAGWRARLGLRAEATELRLASEVAAAGIAKEIRFTGRRADVLRVMASMDVVCSVYHLPAIGRPALEGMAVGCAVVANHGQSGRSSLMHDGENGLLVPPARPEALASAVIRLSQDVNLRRRLGAAGREHARKHFDPEKNTRRLEELYDGLVAAGGRGATAQ